MPTIVASPFTKGDPRSPRVNHNLFDHTSILKFIESNFGLRPLGPRDGSRLRSDPGDLGTTLRRGLGDPSVPRDIPSMPAPPVVTPCGPLNPSPVAASDDTWSGLVASGLLQGWR